MKKGRRRVSATHIARINLFLSNMMHEFHSRSKWFKKVTFLSSPLKVCFVFFCPLPPAARRKGTSGRGKHLKTVALAGVSLVGNQPSKATVESVFSARDMWGEAQVRRCVCYFSLSLSFYSLYLVALKHT